MKKIGLFNLVVVLIPVFALSLVSCSSKERVQPEETKEESDESVSLNQEGTFDDFFLSLATCYSKGNAKEVDKIILTDDNGKKVIADESMIPSHFIDYYKGTFLQSVENKNYDLKKRSNDLFDEWGISKLGLDKNELKNKSEIYEVPAGHQEPVVLCGIYFSYK